MMNRHLRVFSNFLILISIILAITVLSPVLASESEIIPDQVTVLYTSNEHDFSELPIDSSEVKGVENISDTVDVITVKNPSYVPELISLLNTCPQVEATDYDEVLAATEVPNDEYFSHQEGYLNQIGFNNLKFGPNSVKIAVLDTGVFAEHEDLRGQIDPTGYNFVTDTNNVQDDNGHGTRVCGIICAKCNNNLGISGIVKNANIKVVPFKVLNSQGEGSLSDIAAALESIESRDDIKVVNLSLGFKRGNQVLERICQDLTNKNKIVVASSGNDNTSSLYYPAALNTTVSVGSVNEEEQRCGPSDWGAGHGSGFGDGLDLVAPGNDIVSTVFKTNDPNFRYGTGNGTSFSAPFVSAACGLAASFKKDVTLQEIKEKVQQTSKDLYTRGWDKETGYGLLQLDRFTNAFSSQSSPGNQQQPVEPDQNSSIQLNQTNMTLMPGESYQLNVSLNGFGDLVWTSSNPMIASVSNGLVKAVAPGSAQITVQIKGTSQKISCRVLVVEQLKYEAHVSEIGWMPSVSDGGVAGTTGQNLPIEALKFTTNTDNLVIQGQAHVANLGWLEPKTSGEIVGTTGQALRMEALRLSLDGKDKDNYDIIYRAHVQNYGWTTWASNGEPVGTESHALQLEALQVKILPKGSELPHAQSDVNWSFLD